MIMIKFQFSHDRILFIKYWGDEWRSDHILRFLQNTSQRLNLGVPAPVNMVPSVVGWCDVQQLPSLMVLFFIRENELSQIHLQRIDNMSPVDNKESLLIWFKSGKEAELPAITLSNCQLVTDQPGTTWYLSVLWQIVTNISYGDWEIFICHKITWPQQPWSQSYKQGPGPAFQIIRCLIYL